MKNIFLFFLGVLINLGVFFFYQNTDSNMILLKLILLFILPLILTLLTLIFVIYNYLKYKKVNNFISKGLWLFFLLLLLLQFMLFSNDVIAK